MILSSLKRNVSTIMLIVLTGSSVFTGTGIVSASESRPSKGSVKFGADNNPLAGAADKMGSFKTLFGDIAEKVIPTVVSVIPTKVDTIVFQNNPFYNFFGDEQFGDPFEFFFGQPRRQPQQRPQIQKKERRQQGLGSGVIVSKDGYILTNYHVVSGADEIEVKLHDGRTLKAETVGSDSLTDVAVIKIVDKVDKLPVAYLGDSDKMRPGDWAIAVGNPFSLTSTVTTGIVSALGRNVSGNEAYQNFIQTDAAINPGNSGGALVNIDGELIGINTMIYSRSGGYMGIGFAIPVNMAKKVMEDLIYTGKVVRGWIGVTIQDIDQNVRTALDLGDIKGVLIADVIKGQSADKAGIKRGDIIMTIDGKTVDNTNDLRNRVAALSPDKKVPVTVFRGGKTVNLQLVVGKRDQKIIDQFSKSGSSDIEDDATTSKRLGFGAANLTQELRQQYNIPKEMKGVIITSVESGDVPLLEGDVISQMKIKQNDFIHLENVSQLENASKSIKAGESVVFLVHRGGNTFYTAYKIRK